MFCTRRNKWQVDESIPNDEDYRVEVIVSLLRSLCDGYADHAYYIFTYILTEQTRIYLPIGNIATSSITKRSRCEDHSVISTM